MPVVLRVSLIVSWIAVAALQYLDVAATWLVLHSPGGYEWNPLQVAVLTHFGFTGLLLEKSLFAVMAALAFWIAAVPLRSPRLFAGVVAFSCGWLAIIVWVDLSHVVHLI